MNKIKLLIVIQLVRYGGVELVAINFARNLDKSKYDVSFLLIDPYENQDNGFLEELKGEGFHFIFMPKEASGYIGKYRFIDSLFKKGKFDAVHSHVIFFSGIVMLVAKRNGIPVRISHSHITKWNRVENLKYKAYKTVMRKLINRNATHRLACSYDSGCFLYGSKEYEKNGQFIANCIDTAKYAYNESLRAEIRKEFGVNDDCIVVGHVGTVYRIKNQSFLVEVFSKMCETEDNMSLILVGELADAEPVKRKAEELGVFDKVIFTGPRSDAYALYQAFDIFVFPSLHEGLPLSVIEAQASKLPCLVSSSVTKDVKYNDNLIFKSLEASASEWSEAAFGLLSRNRSKVDISKLVASYDVSNAVKILDDIYSGII